MKIILLTAYTKNNFSRLGAFQNPAREAEPINNKIEITPPNMQCKASEAVIRFFFSPSSALARFEIKGLRINPFLIISRMAVTLVNNIQIPISVLGMMRTRKNTFRKPKTTKTILLSNEKTPCEKEREYLDELNFKLIYL